jgi:hypothetical protein
MKIHVFKHLPHLSGACARRVCPFRILPGKVPGKGSGQTMPAFGVLTDQELLDISTFVKDRL